MVVFIVLFAMSWDTLEPTEYGLVQNGFTGYVDLSPDSVYDGGRFSFRFEEPLHRFQNMVVDKMVGEPSDRIPKGDGTPY